MPELKPVLTPDEVAEYLQLTPDTVYRYIRQGRLAATRMGRHYRIRREDVQALLAARAGESRTAEAPASYDVTPTARAGSARPAVEGNDYLVRIPRDVLNSARLTPAQALVELAVHLYAQNKLSFGKARELAGMRVWEFQQLRGSRRIPAHYGLAELDEDEETLRWLVSQ